MKKLLGQDASGTYAFNPTAKTVTFSGLSQAITLANILLITNVTANTIIYNFASSSTGAASFANNVLTLDYDTTSMNSTDVLQVYLDLAGEESLHDLLRRMNKLLESNAVVDSRLRQKVVIEAIGTNLAAPTEVNATVPVSGSVTISSGTVTPTNAVVTQVISNTAANPYSVASSTSSFVMEGPVHQLWRVANDAQACYAQAIRSKLTFS
jgi:hypothetical protein